MEKPKCSEEVRRWYRRIGAKGGQAGKGTELRREIMRRNAAKRWAAVKKAKAAEQEQLRKIFVHILKSAAIERPTSLPVVGFKCAISDAIERFTRQV